MLCGEFLMPSYHQMNYLVTYTTLMIGEKPVNQVHFLLFYSKANHVYAIFESSIAKYY